MFTYRFCAIAFLWVAYSYLYADKVLAGSPLVMTGIRWQSEAINLNLVRSQMITIPMLVEEGADTCFTRRVASNQAVLSTICNRKVTLGLPDVYAIRASVELCAPDSLVSFASFNEYIAEQIDWLAAINAISLSSEQRNDLIQDSKLKEFQYGAYYYVDSLKFIPFVGGGGCPYNPGNLPVPILKSGATNNIVQRIANNNHLIWRGLSKSVDYKVVLQAVSGRQLASQWIRAHGGLLEWVGKTPSQPFLATILSNEGSVVWSALVP